MTTQEKIKILCVRSNISMAELARKIGQSPSNFSAKLKRESFSLEEYRQMAKAVNATFHMNFILENGDKI